MIFAEITEGEHRQRLWLHSCCTHLLHCLSCSFLLTAAAWQGELSPGSVCAELGAQGCAPLPWDRGVPRSGAAAKAAGSSPRSLAGAAS